MTPGTLNPRYSDLGKPRVRTLALSSVQAGTASKHLQGNSDQWSTQERTTGKCIAAFLSNSLQWGYIWTQNFLYARRAASQKVWIMHWDKPRSFRKWEGIKFSSLKIWLQLPLTKYKKCSSIRQWVWSNCPGNQWVSFSWLQLNWHQSNILSLYRFQSYFFLPLPHFPPSIASLLFCTFFCWQEVSYLYEDWSSCHLTRSW